MVRVSNRRVLFTLSGLVAVLVLGVAGYSLVDLDVYRSSTPDSLMPGAASQDLVSLLAAIGLLLCIILLRRGLEKAWLIWVGLLGYLFYAYALYCFEGVYNQLYLFYIAILGLVIYALIIFFMYADLGTIHPQPGKKPPRRATAVLLLLLVVMFVFLWLTILLPAMRDRAAPDGGTIFVLDLAFFLPLLVIEATLLFRSEPLGDALAVPVLVKIGTLGLSVLIGSLLAPAFGQEIDLASVGIYALLGLGPLLFALPFLSSLRVGAMKNHESADLSRQRAA
jgi:hypothetical protein